MSVLFCSCFLPQLLPRIGHFAITLQRMLGTMLTFLLIFVFFSLTFSEILYRIINRCVTVSVG